MEQQRKQSGVETSADGDLGLHSAGGLALLRGAGTYLAWVGRLIIRNRFAIAIASLFWLIVRSGTDPRRLGYPCQQAAAANVGAIAAGLIPTLFLARRRRAASWRPRMAMAGRQVGIAVLMFIVAFVGIETYQFAEVGGFESTLPNVPPPAVEPPPTVVGVVQEQRSTYTVTGSPAVQLYTMAEVDSMVEKAVTLAGGLDPVMVDKDADNHLLVVLKPNLVNTIDQSLFPENGLTTDPRVVAATVRLVKESAARIGLPVTVKIAEGCAGPDPWDHPDKSRRDITMIAYQKTGYDTNADGWFDYDTSVELVDLNDAGTGGIDPDLVTPDPNLTCTKIWMDNAVMRREHWVQDLVLDCDVFISIANLKSHSNADVTLSLKNRFGCAPSDIYHTKVIADHANQMKHQLHFVAPSGINWNIDRNNTNYDYPPYTEEENLIVNYTTVDLNLQRPNDFVIIDGLVGTMNGPAPANNTIIKPDPNSQMIIAGADSVAVDTVCTLLMGYDPQYVRHLRWAYNRELGTMDTARITVKGDHVAAVRQYFGLSHSWIGGSWSSPNGSPVETTPPSLTDISVPDTIVGEVQIQSSGFSQDVVKAELSVRSAPGANLLFNGDFETGLVGQGWTTWTDGQWGSNYFWDFTNAEPGHSGNQCLKLGTTNTTGSYGVYQEVTVEPGKTYRLEGLWKGNQIGGMSWFEILLIDGPWNQQLADSAQPATVVEANYMYAYDENTYGFSHAGITSFPWTHTSTQNSPPGYRVDWNNRKGERTATGNVMTVVLKAGSIAPGIACWFDDMTLREVGEPMTVASLEYPSDPVTFDWDSTEVPDGTYELAVTVYDAGLNEASIVKPDAEVFNSGTFPVIYLLPSTLQTATQVTISPDDSEFTVENAGAESLNYTITTDQPWLSVYPESGSSSGEQDPIMVSYDVTDLLAGTYVGTITVDDPGAINNPKKVTVTLYVETVLPDLDGDGDVDLDDYAVVQSCLGPGGQPPTPGCEDADIDGDFDVDQQDVSRFRQCLSGKGVLAEFDCYTGG